jgi:uncharacterized protein (TIGR01777 family)
VQVAVTGSSGLLGSAIVPALRAHGHHAVRLVRRAAAAPDEVSWDPAARTLDVEALGDVDAVVHLAGAGLGDHRWTAAYRQTIVSSRVDGTATIATALATLQRRDGKRRALLSGSAVGYYGDTGARQVDETAPPGHDFLADTCVRWEAAADPAREAGVRAVHLRSGIVLSRTGGALGAVLPLFRLGVGGRLGNGSQYVSWIALPDYLEAVLFLLQSEAVDGPVNLTAPAPVTNSEYTKAIGAALHRPTVLPVPGVALRLVVGEFADAGLLVGQRVLPQRLRELGFRFAHPDIRSGIAAALA